MNTKFDEAEKKYLETLAWIEKNDFAEGRKILLSIVEDCRDFPNAYGALGWLYYQKFSNNQLADEYYKKGIEVDENYLQNYYFYINFLIDQNRIEDAYTYLKKLEGKKGVSSYEIFNSYGLLSEVEGNYSKAIQNYKIALQKSLNTDALNKIVDAIKRCEKKAEIKNPIITNIKKNRVILSVLAFFLLLALWGIMSGNK